MEKIEFDSGVREYRLGTLGVLRFNPADPNVYARFLEAVDKLRGVEETLVQQARDAEQDGAAAVRLLAQADRQMKQVLGWVFGQENDFDKLLHGVNLLAVGSNGERVVTNLLRALQPVLVAGAQACVEEKKAVAVEKAKLRREGLA